MGTTGASNLTTICRTRATSPCGDTDVIAVACAGMHIAAQPNPTQPSCNTFFTNCSPVEGVRVPNFTLNLGDCRAWAVKNPSQAKQIASFAILAKIPR